jgi:large subunit ribosomal protein L28
LAFKCDVCGKGKMTGHTVSHANNMSNRVWNPNLQKVRALFQGRVQVINACTRCLRGNKVTKAVRGRKVVAAAV